MLLYRRIKILIAEIYHSFKLCIVKFRNEHEAFCRIEEINLEKKIVILYCRGIESPIKFKFDEIVHDVIILSNLLPQHAAWIGYYYGKYYNDLLSCKSSRNTTFKNFHFGFRQSNKRYRIVLQNRQGNIVFLDAITNTMVTKSLVTIISTESLISKFDSIEACYIGMLWGISYSRPFSSKVSDIPKKNLLSVVTK